jgi:hypothetical protein
MAVVRSLLRFDKVNAMSVVLAWLFAQTVFAAPKHSLFLYAGPATGLALVEIIKFQPPTFDPYAALTLGYAYGFLNFGSPEDPSAGVELEGTLSKHFERADMWSGTAAVVARIRRTPWSRLVKSSFAFGNGLSYATVIPYTEALHATRPSQLLYHLSIEYEFSVSDPWSAFLRIHHRSGAFGLFNGAVGGSDFLCLGVRRGI